MRGAMSTQLRSMRRTLHLLTGQPGAESVLANRDGSSLAEREVAVLSLAEFRAHKVDAHVECAELMSTTFGLWLRVGLGGGRTLLSWVASLPFRRWRRCDRCGCPDMFGYGTVMVAWPAVGRLDWIMPAWWSSRLRSALATTGSPKMSPHSGKPRFEVRINHHFPCQASTSWRNGLPPPTKDRWLVSIAHVEFHTSRRVRRDAGSGPRIGDSSGRSGIPGRQR